MCPVETDNRAPRPMRRVTCATQDSCDHDLVEATISRTPPRRHRELHLQNTAVRRAPPAIARRHSPSSMRAGTQPASTEFRHPQSQGCRERAPRRRHRPHELLLAVARGGQGIGAAALGLGESPSSRPGQGRRRGFFCVLVSPVLSEILLYQNYSLTKTSKSL